MMGPDEDLPTLINKKDHLNVLRYIRVHELREPDLVLSHGKSLLGDKLNKKLSSSNGGDSARLAALEQICLAAIDRNQNEIADSCLSKLKETISKDSVRFRCLLGRCLEGSGDLDGAEQLYNTLLVENPSNSVALQRKYCLLKAQPRKEVETMEALNAYLEQNMSDIAAWYEMAQYRLKLGDYKGAAYAMEEVLLGCPLEPSIHCELGELYATIGGLDHLLLARKHMAQSLELSPNNNRRALFGLVNVCKAFLEETATSTNNKKSMIDPHDMEVAKELVKYGVENLLREYETNEVLLPIVKKVMEDHTDDL